MLAPGGDPLETPDSRESSLTCHQLISAELVTVQLVTAALILGAGIFEQLAPRSHVRPPAQQRAALPLGHAAPDSELDAVVERIGEALSADGAPAADQLRPVLGCPLHEQLVRITPLARCACGPVRDPHVAPLLRSSHPRRASRWMVHLRSRPTGADVWPLFSLRKDNLRKSRPYGQTPMGSFHG